MEYKILSKSERIFRSMLDDIRGAKKEILLETYIYDNGKIGQEFLKELISKAQEGVRVRVLLDAWASGVSKSFFKKFVEAGGEVRFFREFRYAFRLFKTNHSRNHRKLLVIDGQVCYIGSINITSTSLNWRELVLRIEEMLAPFFRKSFNDSWKRFNLFKFGKMRKFSHEGFEIIQDSPLLLNRPTERRYEKLIRRAKNSILIETPYFIPPRKIRRELRAAVSRGVVVKLLLPRRSDVKFVDIIRSRYLGKLHRKGIKIYYYPKISHSKLLIVDDDFFLLGSSNLDYRSFRLQYEVNLIGRDLELIRSLKKYFASGLREARAFNYKVWQKRHFFSRAGERIMDFFREFF